MINSTQFVGQGLSALFSALIYAFLQNGFLEELFFRGFITKRLANGYATEITKSLVKYLFVVEKVERIEA